MDDCFSDGAASGDDAGPVSALAGDDAGHAGWTLFTIKNRRVYGQLETRTSLGLEPTWGPMMPSDSIRSIIRAARL